MKHSLVIVYPDGREDSYRIDGPDLVVGSDSSCEVAVQERGIPPRLFRLRAVDGRFIAERLVTGGALSLDGREMAEAEPFPVGGEIRCEGIQFVLRPAPPPLLAAGTESPDGTAPQTDRIRAELGTGWRGYRSILSWLSAAVSPTEAERAESVFRFRQRLFLACLSFAALLLAAIVGAETVACFATVSVLRRFLVLFTLLSSVVLRARSQIAFAGRALFLAAVPAFFIDPPDGPAAEADILLDGWGPVGILCVFLERF